MVTIMTNTRHSERTLLCLRMQQSSVIVLLAEMSLLQLIAISKIRIYPIIVWYLALRLN